MRNETARQQPPTGETTPFGGAPAAQGLYDPRFEHDACGVSLRRRHQGPRRATTSWPRRSARCATSTTAARRAPRSTPATAPGSCSRSPTASSGPSSPSPCPPAGAYGVGLAFLPPTPRRADEDRGRGSRPIVAEEGLASSAGARSRSTPSMLGATALRRDPELPPALRRRPRRRAAGIDLDRKLFVRPQARRARGRRRGRPTATAPSTSRRCRAARSSTRACSPRRSSASSSPTSRDERVESALALVHSRFSTNTFPSWPLAHPYRYIAHNGEINTRAGQPQLDAGPRGAAQHRRCSPATSSASSRSARPGASTPPASTRCSSCCTSAAARLPHAVLMMIPEAWENHATMDADEAGLLPVPRRR